MLLPKWICPSWSVNCARDSVAAWFVGLNVTRTSSELLEFHFVIPRSSGTRTNSILISFHLLQFRHPFWTWSTTTMALMGARQWDAQLKEPLFLILSGWFARILRSMEITPSLSICGQNVSSLGQRTSSAFYFFCWPLFLCWWFLFGLSLINCKIGFQTWTSRVCACRRACTQVHFCVLE